MTCKNYCKNDKFIVLLWSLKKQVKIQFSFNKDAKWLTPTLLDTKEKCQPEEIHSAFLPALLMGITIKTFDGSQKLLKAHLFFNFFYSESSESFCTVYQNVEQI